MILASTLHQRREDPQKATTEKQNKIGGTGPREKRMQILRTHTHPCTMV